MKKLSSPLLVPLAAGVLLLLAVLCIISVVLLRHYRECMRKVAGLKLKRLELKGVEDEISIKMSEAEDLDNIILRSAVTLPVESGDITRGFLPIYRAFIRKSGIRSVGLRSLGVASSPGRFARYRYRADFTGAFPEILRFFNEIESHERFFRIESFEIDGSQNSRGAACEREMRCCMTLSTYSLMP